MAMGIEAFIFKFCDAATSAWVLNLDPWCIGNRPVLLKKYKKGLTFEKLEYFKFPNMVKVLEYLDGLHL